MAAKKKKGAHPNLSAEKVRATALRLIEEDGLDELSTRKLGRALGVEAMAIYWYYPSKEALLDAVVDLLVSKMDPRAMEVQGEWIEALRRLAHAYRTLAHQYPKAFPLLATRRFATAETYGFLETLFAAARDQGLDDRTTARWFRLVSSYCSGVALDELAGRKEAERGDAPEELKNQFPRLVSVSGWLAPNHYDEVFEFGLEVLLDGLGVEVDKRAAKRKNR
jgi:AcrR family transcriptional regulator